MTIGVQDREKLCVAAVAIGEVAAQSGNPVEKEVLWSLSRLVDAMSHSTVVSIALATPLRELETETGVRP